MTSKADPFRKCQAAGCFRAARPDANLCADHYRKVVTDAIDYAREHPTDWTAAHDPHDGGHGDRS